jgi:hypothetical protein
MSDLGMVAALLGLSSSLGAQPNRDRVARYHSVGLAPAWLSARCRFPKRENLELVPRRIPSHQLNLPARNECPEVGTVDPEILRSFSTAPRDRLGVPTRGGPRRLRAHDGLGQARQGRLGGHR